MAQQWPRNYHRLIVTNKNMKKNYKSELGKHFLESHCPTNSSIKANTPTHHESTFSTQLKHIDCPNLPNSIKNNEIMGT